MIVSRDELKQVTGYDYYQGNLIHKPFAYSFFRSKTLPIGNIIAFRAPMEVEAEGMIDLEDMLAKDYIYSEDAINLCWQIPHLDAFGAVAFQRLFNTQIANKLYQIIQKPIMVDGDDIMVLEEFEGSDGKVHDKGKASVSIAYSRNGFAMSHTAINVNAGKRAPGFAYSTKLTDEQCEQFMKSVIDLFYQMVDDITLATSKLTTI